MSKRYADEDFDEAADRCYDEARQRLVDAEGEGEKAGRDGVAVDACPYFGFEPEHAAWHRGRLREIVKQEQERRAA